MLEYLRENLKDIKVRKENNGGIIFLPKYLCHFEINPDALELISTLKKFLNSKSYTFFIEQVSDDLDFDEEETKIVIRTLKENLEREINQFEQKYLNLTPDSYNSTKMDIYEYKTPLKSPVKILLEITNDCNYNCRFCYVYKDQEVGTMLSKPEIDKIIDDASNLGVFFIHLTGGEPLILKDFYSIVKKIREKGMFVSVTTNGWFIENQLDALKLLDPVPIEISLHNVNEKSYRSYISIPNAFQKVLKNIQLLEKNHIRFGIKMVVSKLNFSNVYEMAKLANDLGAESVTYIHLTPTGKGKQISELAFFIRPEIEEFFIQINKARSDFPSLILNYSMFLSIYFPISSSCDDYKNFCPSGITDMRIRYDGEVIQCSSNRNTYFGNIRRNSILEIWKASLNKKANCSLLDFSCSSLKNITSFTR